MLGDKFVLGLVKTLEIQLLQLEDTKGSRNGIPNAIIRATSTSIISLIT
jgi:hypothetical protein